MSRNKQAQALVNDWIPWLKTKAFFGRPNPKHIIAVLSMPDTSGEPPNAKLSAEIAAFHLAVIGLPYNLGRPFVRVYAEWPDMPIKLLSWQEGIERNTYYERAHKAAAMVITQTRRTLESIELLGLRKCHD